MSDKMNSTFILTLNFYKLANILLVNAIVSLETVEQLDSRISLRDQLNNSGLHQLLKQMDNFGYELLSRQIDRYQELADADNEDLYGGMIQNASEDPHEILDSLLNTTNEKRAYGFFVNMLQHMTLIPDEEESQYVTSFEVVAILAAAYLLTTL
jgi:hypothetical protein